jgi:energy-coupling factor transport system substrate-specific component
MNMSFWPFSLGGDTQVSYVPGAPWGENLHRFLVYTVLTSGAGWDTGRAITNALAIALVGPAVLVTLRRAARRAAFDAPVVFEPEEAGKDPTSR